MIWDFGWRSQKLNDCCRSLGPVSPRQCTWTSPSTTVPPKSSTWCPWKSWKFQTFKIWHVFFYAKHIGKTCEALLYWIRNWRFGFNSRTVAQSEREKWCTIGRRWWCTLLQFFVGHAATENLGFYIFAASWRPEVLKWQHRQPKNWCLFIKHAAVVDWLLHEFALLMYRTTKPSCIAEQMRHIGRSGHDNVKV